MWQRAVSSGEVNAGTGAALHVLPVEVPLFDHCQFDALASLPASKKEAFLGALYDMQWDIPEHQAIMRSEGIQKEWDGRRCV